MVKSVTPHKTTTILILALALLSMTPLLPGPFTTIEAHAQSIWPGTTITSPIDFHNTYNDYSPTSLQASNGTLWIAFQADLHNRTSSDIFVKTYTAGSWSKSLMQITNSEYNANPALAQLSDGTILLLWARNLGGADPYQILYERFTTNLSGKGTWSAPANATNKLFSNNYPSATVASDGTLWLVWTRTNSTIQQLYYKTLKAGQWFPESALTGPLGQNSDPNNTNLNFGSSITISKDHIVRIVWSKGTSNWALYYKTFNSNAWSSDQPLTTPGTGTNDDHPSIMQDRNGTLWVYWTRTVTSTASVSILTVGSGDGQNWASPITLIQPNAVVLSLQPSAVQSIDKTIWLFYSSNPETINTSGFGIYALDSNKVAPIHDITIRPFIASPNVLFPYTLKPIPSKGYPGQSPVVTIPVTLDNPGDFNETVTISVAATNTTNYNLGIQTGNLTAGASRVFIFNWNTTLVTPARYGLSVNATIPVESLANKPDGLRAQTNQIHILPLADVDADGIVTLSDVSVFIGNYGLPVGGPSTVPGYTIPFNANLSGSGVVDIVDIGVAIGEYGWTS